MNSLNKNFWFFLNLVVLTTFGFAQNYTEYKGEVIDQNSNKPLEYATISVVDTNISTITNSEGEFILKIPNATTAKNLQVTLLGYQTKVVALANLTSTKSIIKLAVAVTQLSEVNIKTYKNAQNLVRLVLKNKKNTRPTEDLAMTAFYRETIKRRQRNVSLTEAVLYINKQPVGTSKQDAIKLGKARKQTDYKRLDTLTLKLQGGPFSALRLDMLKYPNYLFSKTTINDYEFSFAPSTTIEDKVVMVVNFKSKTEALNISYEGKLYIDAKNLALVGADYNLNLSNKTKAKNLLVKKKPRHIVVLPMVANYKVNFKENNGKWYYNYASFYLKFKVNKKRRWFNKVYTLQTELAVTDWQTNAIQFSKQDALKPNVIITDAISGFGDPNFWGAYNLIEPDKSIESAIRKIQKKLKQ